MLLPGVVEMKLLAVKDKPPNPGGCTQHKCIIQSVSDDTGVLNQGHPPCGRFLTGQTEK